MVEEPPAHKHLHDFAHAVEEEVAHLVHEVIDDLGPDHTFDDILDHVAATSANQSSLEIQQRIARLAGQAGMETNPDVIRPWAEAISEGSYHTMRRHG